MGRLTDGVLGHRLVVLLLWLLVAAAGGATTTSTVDRLSFEFALPGQPAYEANQDIQQRFGGGGLDDPLLLVARGDGAADDRRSHGRGRPRAAARARRVVTVRRPGCRALASADGTASRRGALPAGDART